MLRLSAMGFLPLFIFSPIKQHPDICSTGANLQSQHKPPSPPAVQHKQVFLCAALHVLAIPAAGKHAHIAAFPPPIQNDIFFLVTISNSSQQFPSAATNHGLKVTDQKNISDPELQAAMKVCCLGNENLGRQPTHTAFPSPIQMQNKRTHSHGFPQGYQAFKGLTFSFSCLFHVTI